MKTWGTAGGASGAIGRGAGAGPAPSTAAGAKPIAAITLVEVDVCVDGAESESANVSGP